MHTELPTLNIYITFFFFKFVLSLYGKSHLKYVYIDFSSRLFGYFKRTYILFDVFFLFRTLYTRILFGI